MVWLGGHGGFITSPFPREGTNGGPVVLRQREELTRRADTSASCKCVQSPDLAQCLLLRML